jgi:hypothetical protein
MADIDLLPNLSPAVARHTLFLLTEALPAPLSDLPEERAARDAAAIAAVVALRPGDAFEARLAARAVAADAHAMDSLRLAALPGQQPDEVRRCRAQASAMMRAAEAALRSLRVMQTVRDKAGAPAAAGDGAAASASARDLAAEADDYALRHHDQAALIRDLGSLSGGPDGGAVPPELLAAIVTGSSPILRALDRPDGGRLAKAA